MTEDYAEEFLTIIPQMESAPAVQATTMVPSRTVAPRVEADLPFE
jgi:hypothetical protein